MNHPAAHFPRDTSKDARSANGRGAARPHQEEAIQAIVSALGKVDRVQAHMACGSGKTRVGLWVAEDLGAKRVLVLVPSLVLVRQLLAEWREHAETPFQQLIVCSDESIHEVGLDDSLLDRATTSVRDVAAALGADLPSTTWRVVVATYQSSPVIAEALDAVDAPFDLVVCDEAHWAAGVGEGPSKTVLSDEAIPARNRLFMTATPRIAGEALGETDEPIACMDDASLFGPVAYELPFSRAIELGLLVDYQVLVLGVPGNHRDPEGTGLGPAAVCRALADGDASRMVTFHSSVARAVDFAERQLPPRLSGAGLEDVEVQALSGRVPVRRRQEILDALAEPGAGRHVVANCKCLSEGIDVPSIDTVVFVDPRTSTVSIAQAVGRALRLSPQTGKRRASIVLPVALGEEDDPDEVLGSASFRGVYAVLRALQAHDDRLVAEITRRATDGESRVGGTSERIDLDLPDGLEIDLARVALRVVVGLSPRATSFAKVFEELRDEVRDRGWDGLLSRSPRLHNFALRRRRPYLEGGLSRHLRELFESLPAWDTWCRSARPLRTTEEVYADLRSEVQERGWKGLAAREPNLNSWADKRRREYLSGRCSATVRVQLEALPGWIEWCESRKRNRAPAVSFAELKAVVGEEGWAGVRSRKNLSGFARRKRAKYLEGSLAEPECRELEAIPGWGRWCEQARPRRGLDERISELARAVEAHDWSGLGRGDRTSYNAADRYRRRYVSGELSFAERKALESLPGWSRWCESRRSRRRPEALVDQLKVEVLKGGWEGLSARARNLYTTAYRRGLAYRAGELSPEECASLEAIPGWKGWCRSFRATPRMRKDELRERLRMEVTARGWTGLSGRNVRLYEFARRQRRRYLDGDLNDEERRGFDAIEGWQEFCRRCSVPDQAPRQAA